MEEWRPSSELRRPLPARVINTAHLPQVWNQGDLGICGSFAPTYYVRNYYESKARGEGRWNPNNAADQKKLVSPMWTVLTSHHGGGTYGPWGGFMYEACETLCNRGYLTVDELRTDWRKARRYLEGDDTPLDYIYLFTYIKHLNSVKA